VDSLGVHFALFDIAFIRGDAAGMQREIAWAGGKPRESYMIFDKGESEYSLGRAQKGRETVKRAVSLADSQGFKEAATNERAEETVLEATLGNIQEARQEATEVLSSPVDRDAKMTLASSLALCGDTSRAQKLIDELAKDFPLDTLLNNVSLPTARAIIEMQHNNPTRAITLLEAAAPYDLAGYWLMYVRGEAYLQARDGVKAAAEFQKILDHRGIDPLDPIYSLARLDLGRALALQGQAATARTAYQDFLALWKDADPDIPILKQAKEEYEKLR
jgi:predicted Zn-dependent protease